jgi:hypothetical protein
MKYILTTNEGGIIGPLSSLEQVAEGYMGDDTLYPSTVTGEVIKSEVDDDYVNPTYKEPIQIPPIKQFQPTTETVVTDAPVIADTPVEPVVEPTIEGAV